MKIKVILSSCVLLLFAILAGGSFDGGEFFIMLVLFCLIIFITIVVLIIHSRITENNKKKRLKMIELDEAESNDFDRSVSYGNDRCKFYFDASKKQVMIMRVMTEGINKLFVDNFEYGGDKLCRHNDPYFCIYDNKNRKILAGEYKGMTPTYSVKEINAKDKYKDTVPNSNIEPRIIVKTLTTSDSFASPTASIKCNEYVYTLLDESHGFIAVVKNGKITSLFNYINGTSLFQKTGTKSYVNEKSTGNYLFLMDDFFNVLVIITPHSYEIFNYSDIIDVSYEEDGTQLYSKSTMRTVGGAVVGGVLMGGAGAVVGGLSGASKKNMEIDTMQIKILLRKTNRTSCILDFNETKRVLKTKDAIDKAYYERFLKNANEAKDVLFVIIDKAKQSQGSPAQQIGRTMYTHHSIADEITKLAKLKADGILTEEEFNAQKEKFLNQ